MELGISEMIYIITNLKITIYIYNFGGDLLGEDYN